MPPVGIEPTISGGERPQTYALDRAATGTGVSIGIHLDFWKKIASLQIHSSSSVTNRNARSPKLILYFCKAFRFELGTLGEFLVSAHFWFGLIYKYHFGFQYAY